MFAMRGMGKARLALPPLVLWLAIPLAQAAPEPASEFFIGNASEQYDFVLRLEGVECPPQGQSSYETCEGPGRLEIHRKAGEQPVQVIELENLFLSFDGARTPLVNSARRYEYQGAINVGDFNFDGHEDFAVQDGNQGSYGGPSYQVYLYSPAEARFQPNDAMTELIASTLGFFEVDTERRQLATAAKSGCCYHEYVRYEVVDDTPQPVHRLIEDAMGSAGEGKMSVTEETLVHGKWRTKVKVVDIDQYYGN